MTYRTTPPGHCPVVSRMAVGGRDDDPIGAFVDLHDPVHRVLLPLASSNVTDERQQLVAMRIRERSGEGHEASRQLVLRPPARRAANLVCASPPQACKFALPPQLSST